MTRPTPQPGILDIALYQGGASKLATGAPPLKLSSNENPLGPSPVALTAIGERLADLHRYPSTDHAPLREAIAEIHALEPARIICGVGSDEIITFLCQAYAGPGDEVLYPEHGFLMYKISALAAGATPVTAPETARAVDVDKLLAAVTPRTRLVFLANPANPTGTFVSEAEITRLADGLPRDCLLVLDGAYAEYIEGFDGGAALAQTRENVVMTRTFSKIYGLGGLRVGWGYGPQAVIDVLNRVRGPFNLSAPALAAAEAAVRDQDFVAQCREMNRVERQRLAQGLAQMGYPSDPSEANFILVRFTDEATALAADAHLKAHAILVRHVAGYGFAHGLRITVGTKEDITAVLDAMASFKAEA